MSLDHVSSSLCDSILLLYTIDILSSSSKGSEFSGSGGRLPEHYIVRLSGVSRN